MNTKQYTSFLLFVISLACIFVITPGSAEDDTRASLSTNNLNDIESSVADASRAYRELIKDAKVPSSVLKNARCIAVFPKVVTTALAVGGTHGDGVAFCRNSELGWANPVFLNMNGGSLGIQAGVKSTDIVLYLTGDDARSMVKKGTLRLTGDLSAVAGSFEKTYAAPTKGVIAYANTGGAFAGAAIGAVDISHDQDEQRAFYGTYDPNSLFEGKIPPKVEKSVNELRSMLPA